MVLLNHSEAESNRKAQTVQSGGSESDNPRHRRRTTNQDERHTMTTTINAQIDRNGIITRLRTGAPDGNRDEVTLDLADGETPRIGDHVTVDEDGVATLY